MGYILMTIEHNVIVSMVKRVQKRLQDADMSYFRLDIEVYGDVHGKPTMTYKLGKSYGEGQVEGNSMDAVVEEFLRQQGWKATNKPLELTFDEPEKVPSPFEDDKEHYE